MPSALSRKTLPSWPPAGRVLGSEVLAARVVPVTWWRPCLACIGAGIAAFGGLPLTGMDRWAGPGLGVGVAGGAVAAVLGEQNRYRRQTAADIEAAVAPLASAVALRMTRWQRGWQKGWRVAPGRIRMRYLPEVDDGVANWTQDIAAVVSRRLTTAYIVVGHDRRRRRLELAIDPAVPLLAVRKALHVRAERLIREVLGAGAHAKVSWADDDSLHAIEVRHEAGARVATAAQRARIERVVSTMLPGRWRARWELERDLVRFELRPELPRDIPHPAEELTTENRLLLSYGVDEDGDPLAWNLTPNAVEPHHLVIGTTGSGKSAEINSLILEAARRGFAIYITDPKRIEFMGLRDWPNVVMVATAVEEMVAVVHRLHELMEDRYRAIEMGEAEESDFDPVILILDEFRNFHRLVTAWYAATKIKGMPAKCPIFDEVAALAEKGRSAHVHLATGSQRPDSQWLGGDMRDNFRSRVSMGRLSPQGAMMMWDAAHIGVAIPRGLPGRGTAMGRDGNPVEMQAYWTPDPRRTGPERPEDQAILDRLRPKRGVHEPLVVVPPEANEDGSTPTYWDWTRALFVPASVRPDLRVPGRRPSIVLPASADESLDESDTGTSVLGSGDGYGPAEQIGVQDLAAGDLLELDNVWVVVESAEEDVADPGNVCVSWCDDGGGDGFLSVSDGEVVQVRHPDA